MADINVITSRIIEDSKSKAEDIIKEAEAKAAAILFDMEKTAEKEAESILSRASKDASLLKEKVISEANLKVRDEILSAKQELLNRVFDEAEKKLDSLSDEEKIKMIEDAVLNITIDGDYEIIVDVSLKDKFNSYLDNINEKIMSSGAKYKLKLSDEDRTIGTGFILARDGIEINYTVSSLMNSLKEELEWEVAKVLFEG